jgi:hypothetical protein
VERANRVGGSKPGPSGEDCGALPGEAALGAKCEWVRAGVAGGARRCVFVLAGGRILGWTWRTRGMFLFRPDEGT